MHVSEDFKTILEWIIYELLPFEIWHIYNIVAFNKGDL